MTIIATVAAVYSDGLTLKFDGQETPTKKHYKHNRSASFAVGDRVVALGVSGTYVIICKI